MVTAMQVEEARTETSAAERIKMVEAPREPTEGERLDTEAATDDWADLIEGAPVASPAEFHIDSDERADWLLRKIADAKARAARAKEWAEREVERAEVEEVRLLARFECELVAYTKKRLATGKKRSFSLPSGTCGFRKVPAWLKVTDEVAALAWAKKNAPSAVVTIPATERLSKTDLAAAVKNTGVIPDGADMTEEEDRFYIK